MHTFDGGLSNVASWCLMMQPIYIPQRKWCSIRIILAYGSIWVNISITCLFQTFSIQCIPTTFTRPHLIHLGMKRHLEKLRAARNEKSARHDYDATAGSSSRSSSTGSVPSGMVGFWGGATPPLFCCQCWGCDGLTSGWITFTISWSIWSLNLKWCSYKFLVFRKYLDTPSLRDIYIYININTLIWNSIARWYILHVNCSTRFRV